MRFEEALAIGSGHQLSGAVATTWMQSDIALSVNPFGASPVRARQLEPIRWRVYGFLEDQIAFGDHVNLTLGARLTYLPGPNAVHGEPRLSLRYDRKTGIGQWAIRWATGLYRQYVHSFDVTTYNVTSLFPRVRYWLGPAAETTGDAAARDGVFVLRLHFQLLTGPRNSCGSAVRVPVSTL